ncbi:MAG: glycosyltransferase [Firmicutes bacterium]|nr:glycosyltransferase [Bacillota bacterium]
MPPLASVVIPTYNRREYLLRCLRSLFAQTVDPSLYEIVIIDDGSTDGTREAVEEIRDEAPCPLIYIWQENSGRARARNKGIRAARGRYIIFLDSDMTVKPDFIAAHLAAHAAANRVVHGAVIDVHDPDEPHRAQKPPTFSRAFFATGNVSVERERLIAAGLFDENFQEYGWEDLELGGRLRRLGLRAVKSPEAVSYHLQDRLTSAGIESMIQKEKERGHTAVLFYRKNPSLRVRLMTNLTPVAFILDRLLLCPFRWLERPWIMKLLKKLESKGHRRLFLFLAFLLRNHAYVEGLREGLAKMKRGRLN